MVLSDDGDCTTETRFDELCLDLNLDQCAKDGAWQSFCKISTNYTLEGDGIHWLACALYVACRKSVVPTVGKGVMEGNGVSLTRLLRSSKLSLIEFFKKMKNWQDMAGLSQDFSDKVDRLERNFAVSTVIFKKFEPIFVDVFHDPKKDPPKAPRGRKQKRLPCTASDVFNFCWTTFVQVKGNFVAISDDLVNSYHLLLCCIDWFFSNALLGNRQDLLNPNFSGLPESFGRDKRPPSEVPCILQVLCDKHEGLLLEAKGIKEHWWKPYMKKLFDKKALKGKAENLTGILDIGNYEANSKAIKQLYEEYVLSFGDFDETIFLLAEAEEEIGTPAKSSLSLVDVGQRVKVVRSLRQHFDETTSLAPSTPLTGRRYLAAKEEQITPVSTATQSVSRLQTMLSGRRTSPSDTLIHIFKSCSRNPIEEIQQRVREMGETFCTTYTQPSVGDYSRSTDGFAHKRLQLAESLYYKALENILNKEKERVDARDTPLKTDFSCLLEQDIFHRSLFACCLEIVIFSYNSQRAFPWIVDVFHLSPYYFYKVIEVLIRAEENLSRDVIKHLNHIEELILDCLVWKTESPFWASINSTQVPSVEDVSLPNQIEHESGSVVSASSSLGGGSAGVYVSSPVAHPALRRVVGSERVISPNPHATSSRDPSQSPTGNALDLFNSPAPGSAKRKLFTTGTIPGSSTTVKSLLKNADTSAARSFTLVKTEDGNQMLIPVKIKPVTSVIGDKSSPAKTTTDEEPQKDADSRDEDRTQASPATNAPTTDTPKTESPSVAPKTRKMSSMHLFFRKVYHLASVRLRDICERLDVDSRLRSQMWTCFEHALMHHCDLLEGRHLDQILMCCVYVMAKVTEQDRSFQDIMRCYRLQPQAQSHVYRSVLLSNRRRHSSGGSSSGGHNGNWSGSSSPVNEVKNKSPGDRLATIRSTSTLPGATPGSQPPTPTRFIGGGGDGEDQGEDRGDLIKFYNQIFVKKIRVFALKFSSHNLDQRTDVPILSPLPAVRSHPSSPRRRVSTKHSVYVSPHKSHVAALTPQSKMLYCFNRSPAKDLQAINTMLTNVREAPKAAGIKRLLRDTEDKAEPKRFCLHNSPLINQRLGEVMTQRNQANGTR